LQSASYRDFLIRIGLTLKRWREKSSSAKALRRRASEALGGYIGNIDVLKNTIEIAVRLLKAANRSQ
jgi:hypothetical protein